MFFILYRLSLGTDSKLYGQRLGMSYRIVTLEDCDSAGEPLAGAHLSGHSCCSAGLAFTLSGHDRLLEPLIGVHMQAT
jgi:hypothetical protein